MVKDNPQAFDQYSRIEGRSQLQPRMVKSQIPNNRSKSPDMMRSMRSSAANSEEDPTYYKPRKDVRRSRSPN